MTEDGGVSKEKLVRITKKIRQQFDFVYKNEEKFISKSSIYSQVTPTIAVK